MLVTVRERKISVGCCAARRGASPASSVSFCHSLSICPKTSIPFDSPAFLRYCSGMLSISSIELAVFILPIISAFYMNILPLIGKNSTLSNCGLRIKLLDPSNRRSRRPAMPRIPVYFFSHGGVSKQRWTLNDPARHSSSRSAILMSNSVAQHHVRRQPPRLSPAPEDWEGNYYKSQAKGITFRSPSTCLQLNTHPRAETLTLKLTTGCRGLFRSLASGWPCHDRD